MVVVAGDERHIDIAACRVGHLVDHVDGLILVDESVAVFVLVFQVADDGSSTRG